MDFIDYYTLENEEEEHPSLCCRWCSRMISKNGKYVLVGDRPNVSPIYICLLCIKLDPMRFADQLHKCAMTTITTTCKTPNCGCHSYLWVGNNTLVCFDCTKKEIQSIKPLGSSIKAIR